MPVSASLPQLNRFFVHPQYSIYHRCVKRLHWTNGARSDFGVFFLLEGRLEYEIEDQSGEIKREQLFLFEPSVGASAKGQSAEFLLLRVSSSFVMDYAVRMRLIVPGTTVAFQLRLVERDGQLLRL